MNSDDKEYPELRKRINQHMDGEVENIDTELARELFAARQRALNAIPDKSRKQPWLLPLWLTGAMVGGFVLAAMFMLLPSPNHPADEFSALATIVSGDDLEMLEQELEFYVWLENEGFSNSG
jgi:hypothetical protein